MKAVQVHIISVSVNTPKVWISPCLTGWETSAVAATFGADPIPASLLNRPRLIPCIKAIPIPPPNACSQPNALAIMISMTSGKRVMFIKTMVKAKRMYPKAINGTMMLLTLAMRWMPPKIINTVRHVRIIPIKVLST